MENHQLNRRRALQYCGLAALLSSRSLADDSKPKQILLRSSWQTVNIGDIAHTPGVLRILESHLPEVKVTLWPSKVDNGVREILQARFPSLAFATSSAELKDAFQQCQFLLHGSGPSLVARKDVIRWSQETGKPYGIYGITLPPKESSATVATSPEVLAETIRVLSGAAFVYFRDSHSLRFAQSEGCSAPLMQFGPDGAFACDLRDDQRATAFLNANGLEEQKYLCCIPRLRYTPYWKIKDVAIDPKKQARNEEMKEHDHAQLRSAMIEVVRNTKLKILVCPEDQTQMQVGKELLVDPLPSDVRERIVWRPNYWLPGEAISTYVRSAGLFGNEMHSPIMSIGHGVPAIVCRWAEQTTKGYMWEDIGLGEWLFNLDLAEDVKRIVPTVMELANNPEAARQKAHAARERVELRQAETMSVLKNSLA